MTNKSAFGVQLAETLSEGEGLVRKIEQGRGDTLKFVEMLKTVRDRVSALFEDKFGSDKWGDASEKNKRANAFFTSVGGILRQHKPQAIPPGAKKRNLNPRTRTRARYLSSSGVDRIR